MVRTDLDSDRRDNNIEILQGSRHFVDIDIHVTSIGSGDGLGYIEDGWEDIQEEEEEEEEGGGGF
jgi:hypothetical protein